MEPDSTLHSAGHGAPWCTTPRQAVLQLLPEGCNAVLRFHGKTGRSQGFTFLFDNKEKFSWETSPAIDQKKGSRLTAGTLSCQNLIWLSTSVIFPWSVSRISSSIRATTEELEVLNSFPLVVSRRTICVLIPSVPILKV